MTMNPTRAFRLITEQRIRKLILADNRFLEKWNDEEQLSGDDRDRLGAKEARFQSLLAQVLRENNFDVVVESYLSRESKKRYFSSCDLYAYDRNTRKSYWIEIKRQDLNPRNNSGGKDLMLQVFSDIGKMLAGKDKADIAVIWIGFWGSEKHIEQLMREPPSRFKFPIRAITPRKLKQLWQSKEHSLAARNGTKRLIGNSINGSVSEVILDLAHWFRRNNEIGLVKAVQDPKYRNKQEWGKYGVFAECCHDCYELE